ncbi:hypothetical protein XAP3CFBP6996_001820 [Xanthomonas citri pv. fuscans CFBP 6996]|nr:hypothetical protein XAP3CFBP6996_001820 [Xanthomonas citri pv. fuscans CFBP 6996]QWN14759.1 hypothetical protein DGN02_01835 [Xanthomonas citri]
MGEHGGAESQIPPVRRSAPGRDEALPVNPIAPWAAPTARAAGAPSASADGLSLRLACHAVIGAPPGRRRPAAISLRACRAYAGRGPGARRRDRGGRRCVRPLLAIRRSPLAARTRACFASSRACAIICAWSRLTTGLSRRRP